MKNSIKFKLVLIIIFILITGTVYSDLKDNKAGVKSEGYGIKGSPDYFQMLEKPVKIIKKYNNSVKNRFSIISDYHMLIPCSLDKLADVLSDLDLSENVFPRMAESEVYYHAEYPEETFYQRVKTDFETLGFGKEYEYTLKVYFDEKTDKKFMMRWILNKSSDNTFSVFEGSWYCEKVLFQGKTYTYLRNFSETEFIDPGFITVFAVKHFSESEIKKAFQSISTAVQ